jgi:cephalosporin-C deacetylase-like acetyl esterase
MSGRGSEQAWVLDGFLRSGGLDALHPQSTKSFEMMMSLDASDIKRVFDRVEAAPMMPKAWAEVAAEMEGKARHYAERGNRNAAFECYRRATTLWGRAQYSIFDNTDPRKQPLRMRTNACMDAFIENAPAAIVRVTIEFDGFNVYGLLHHPHTASGAAPLIVLVPGMDMIKEDFNRFAQQELCTRGFAVLTLDGPGQGETLYGGLHVTTDNYERAVSAMIDAVVDDARIDAGRIGAFGCSWGSYMGVRTAAHDPRIKVLATTVGHYGNSQRAFDTAQPKFKANYMYMTGYTDEARFDEEIASKMELLSVAPKLACPVLMSIGEFDELTLLSSAFALYEAIEAPKELVVWEQEFHGMGGVTAESLMLCVDWLERGLRGEIPADHVEQVYMRRNGEPQVGSARPSWWTVADAVAAVGGA